MGRMHFRYLLQTLGLFLIACTLVACGSAPSTDAEQPEATVESVASAAEPTMVAEPTLTPLIEVSESADPATNVAGERLFEIDQSRSEARFLVDEVLLGVDKTVVGATSQITGSITVNPDDPTAASISAITIDARSLATDSSRRNRSVQRRILGSAADEFRYITFEPTAIDGLPQSVTIGETFAFSVTGDLTVRGVTHPETFSLSVTPNSATELTGLGKATVLYEDYELAIPEVPAVAGVEDEVRLEIEFVATAEE